MSSEVQFHVQDLVNAALSSDDSAIVKLLNKRPIHARDAEGLSATMHLAIRNKTELFQHLLAHGAYSHDLACGAAYANNTRLLELIISRFPNIISRHGNVILHYAARNNHSELIFNFITKHRDTFKLDSNWIAAGAARGGHTNLINMLLKAFPNINDKHVPAKPDFALLAQHAAEGNQQKLTFKLLAKITRLETKDCVRAATHAAWNGNQELVFKLLSKAPNPDEIDYNLLASYAAGGGNGAFALELLSKAPLSERQYFDVAEMAQRNGHDEVARIIRLQKQSIIDAGAQPPLLTQYRRFTSSPSSSTSSSSSSSSISPSSSASYSPTQRAPSPASEVDELKNELALLKEKLSRARKKMASQRRKIKALEAEKTHLTSALGSPIRAPERQAPPNRWRPC